MPKTRNPVNDLSIQSFIKGLVYTANPESIPDEALVQADNFEFDQYTGSIRTAPGIRVLVTQAEEIGKGFYDKTHAVHIFSMGTNIYKTDLNTVALIGALTGLHEPVFCLYDTKVLIASGGQLQSWDGTTLSTIADSPVCHYVSYRKGRAVVFNITNDLLSFSAIGDYTAWTNVPADTSSGQSINIGYKDASSICSVAEQSQDLLIFKSSGRLYRMVGDFPDEAVYEVSQTAYSANQYSAVSIVNNTFFVGQMGIWGTGTTQSYGDVAMEETGANINPQVILQVDTSAKIWHVYPRRQLWIKTQNDKSVYIFHYNTGAFTRRTFKYQISDVWCEGTKVYVAYGTKIAIVDTTIATDDSSAISCQLKSKRWVASRLALFVTRILFETSNMIAGDYFLTIGNKTIATNAGVTGDIAALDTDIAALDTDPAVDSSFTRIFQRVGIWNSAIDIRIVVNTGAIAIRNICLGVTEI